ENRIIIYNGNVCHLSLGADKSMINSVNSPGLLFTVTVPPMASTWLLIMKRPTPLASLFPWNVLLSLNMLLPCLSKSIPNPWSLMLMNGIPFSSHVLIWICGGSEGLRYLIAFDTRFVTMASRYSLLYFIFF